MKAIKQVLLAMVFGFLGVSCGAQKAPEGQLLYCSYSRTGMAGLGKDYCELIADKDSIPKVVVALRIGNRFGEPEIHAEYPVDNEVVESLRAGLAERKVYELNGYALEEAMTGGHSYRIYQEYDSGEKINAYWYGHEVKQEAWAAYSYIESFFAPWRKKAREQNDAQPGTVEVNF